MDEKEPIFKSFISKVITGVLVTIVSGLIVARFSGFLGSELTADERNKKIFSTLEKYATDLNEKRFDAYKYFAPNVDRFYQMFDTSPKKINKYVNGLFYEQFQNATTGFDESTLSVREIESDGYEVTIIMFSTYYDANKKKQFNDFRTRTELKFDTDFHIKYFRQFLE